MPCSWAARTGNCSGQSLCSVKQETIDMQSCEKVLGLTCFFKNWCVLCCLFCLKTCDWSNTQAWIFLNLFNLHYVCIDGKLFCILMRIHQTNLKTARERDNYLARILFYEFPEDMDHKILLIRPKFAKFTETR